MKYSGSASSIEGAGKTCVENVESVKTKCLPATWLRRKPMTLVGRKRDTHLDVVLRSTHANNHRRNREGRGVGRERSEDS